jgi:hypothetical protein
MAKTRTRRPTQTRLPLPDEFRDETIVIPDGSPSYWLLLDDSEVEKISTGRLPQRVMEICWRFLSWKREREQDWATYPDALKPPKIEPW